MNTTQIEKLMFLAFFAAALGMRAAEMWRKRGTERGVVSMRWSFYAMVGTAGLVYAVTLLEFLVCRRDYHLTVGVAGMVLYGASVWLRLAAIRALGRHWSLHIEIRQQHPLVNTGPYRWVRHPAYAAFVLELVGVPLAGNAWWALAVAALGYGPVLWWRIRREEAALVGQLGETYRAYRARTGMLLPRLGSRGAGAAL